VCGTDGLQAHASDLGIVMGHDRKSVRCVLALESAFLRPRGPPTEVPATAGFHACGRILGCLHMIFVATRQCAATAQYTSSCSRGVCVVKCPCSRDLQLCRGKANVHVTVLRFGVAVGAPELLRGRTVAQKIVLVALSNFAQWGIGRRLRVHKILPPKVAKRPLRVCNTCLPRTGCPFAPAALARVTLNPVVCRVLEVNLTTLQRPHTHRSSTP
jgi:hypothetical protein